MTSNSTYLVTAALAAVVVALTYQVYQERNRTSGVEINLGGRSISIETK
jgi:hypothetical protein